MIPRFFIDRPIFAAVLSIVITLTGAITLFSLPLAQYPEISPPSVQVSISYPGASAQVVADTVAAPIEQQVNGVEGMLYMSSQSGNDGSYTLTVTFDVGTDLNTALVMVQNRVTLALPQLPTQVQQQGITIKKKTPDILLVISLYSPHGRYDDIYLSNYATIYIRDEIFRIDGVSDINYLGERDYSIRVWLDPQKLAALNISAGDVTAAILSQNIEVAAGQIGQPPTNGSQSFQLPINTLGRLSDPVEFGDIIVKASQSQRAGAQTNTASQPITTNQPRITTQSTMTGMSSMSNMMGQGLQSGTNNPLGTLDQGNPNGMNSPTNQSGTNNTSNQNSSSNQNTSSGQNSSQSTSSSQSSNQSTQNNIGNSGAAGGLVGQNALTPIVNQNQPGSSGVNYGGMSNQNNQGNQSSTPVRLGVSGPQPQAVSIVRIRDVAHTEMGAQNYNQACTFDGRPSVGLGVHQLPGTNALDVADRIRKKMEELKQRFPEDLDYEIAYDTAPFIRESVMDVVQTLLEAVVLVAIVVLAFLQNWRAAFIPLIAVPVAIIGTFAVMAAVGFSLNNISLFGLVLAIGIVVDDAIVVVENVERWLEQGIAPREAARKAMDEVTGPVIAVALVLCAVFVPCAFIGGITGRFFRQFAVTIAASTVFSAFNSLTLSPALAAILLKPRGSHRDPLTRLLDFLLGWFFNLFNKVFSAGTYAYVWSVSWLVRLSVIVLLAYGGLVILTYFVFTKAPVGFIPDQDQGRLIVSVQLPDSASLQRTQKAVAQIEKIADKTPGIAHTATASGMSLLLSANSSNFATMFIVLDPFEKRRKPELSANAIMEKLRREYARQVKDAIVNVLGAPPIPGLSVAGGFKVMVEDRAGMSTTNLQRQTERLIDATHGIRGLVGVITQFRANTPQLYMDIDRTKAQSLGVSINDVNQALEVYLGSLYVNSFNVFGRYWQVTIQAEGDFRRRLTDVNLIQVPNNRGEMVPLGTLTSLRYINGPVMVQRYNLYPAAPITGNILPGLSTGDTIAAIDDLAKKTLPRTMSTEWTELMFIQIRAGNTALSVFAIAVLFVFLSLSALYESWSLPLAVILVVPLCLLCSVAGVLLTHTDVNIFVQIGLVVLVGLACKNAILIVEFAKQLREQGQPRLQATLDACRLRLRPILMTSFAFILGVIPLVIAEGAGAEMRRSLGTAVFSGMLGVTLFGIFLTPVFFAAIDRFSEIPLFGKRFENRLARHVAYLLFGVVLGLALGFLLSDLAIISPRFIYYALLGCALVGSLIGEFVFRGYPKILSTSARHSRPAGNYTGDGTQSGDRHS